MKRLSKFSGILVLTLAMTLGLYANGLNLNSNGSKAIAMGGAFVGLADDYSAVFWNPAGLTQMKETNIAVFLTDIIPSATYKWDLVGIDTKAESKHYPSGGLGFFKPLSEKVVAGIYVHVPSGVGVTWNGADLAALTAGTAYEWENFLGVVAVSPAIAFKLSEQFSLGIAVNIDYGMLKVKRPALGQYDEDLSGWAVGATIGMLYKPTEKFSFGLSYKLPMKVTVKGEANMSGAPLLGLPGTDDAEREATWPMWLGAGICVKPTEKLTFTFDVQYTNWKKMEDIPISFSNAGWIAFFEESAKFNLRWKDQVMLRFGFELMASPTFAVRAGFYTDPVVSPIDTHNILLPELGYNWITFGIGYKGAKMALDVSVEYGFGKDIEVGIAEADPAAGMPGIHGMSILVPNIALTIYL
jgi:long-chain fatty acid transport protein